MKVFKRIKKVMVATLIAAMTLGAVTGCSSYQMDHQMEVEIVKH